FNTPLLMSTVALASGAALYYLLRNYLAQGDDEPPFLPRIDGRRIFDRFLVAISWRFARFVERRFGTRKLQPQLRVLVVVAIAAAAWPAYRRGLDVVRSASPLDPALAIAWIVGGACAVAAAWQAKFHRLAALILASGAGLVTCVTFVWFSAPDLALTQLAVETVTAVLLLLGLRWLPKPAPYRWTLAGERAALPRRFRDLAISLLAGGGLAAIAYAVMMQPVTNPISAFFVTNALPRGGGTNVVNVILVDFRGFDTLGEITVLGAVAIAVYSLLRRFRPARESMDPLPQQREQSERTSTNDLLVPSVIMRAMFGAILVLAFYLLLRGHDLPGGGFIAGVVFAIGLILQYMAGGTRFVEDRLVIRPVVMIGLGLAIAGATGAGAWLFAHPFLTSHVAHVDVPPFGELHLPSAMLFDIGVFLLVVGATTLMLVALAHQSLRARRGELSMSAAGPPQSANSAPSGGSAAAKPQAWGDHPTMLEITRLASRYGGVHALSAVTLSVARNELVALVGANGAGKTTLLRVLSGVHPASAGSIAFQGVDITRMPASARVRRGIVQVPEGRQMFGPMSVEDNLRLGAYTRPQREIPDALADVYARFPILAAKRRDLAGNLSGGQQQMLAIGRALMAKPVLLLLDEPSMGLAPKLVAEIFAAIRTLRDAGTTILLVDQNARAALAIADRAYVLETGRIALTGRGRDVLADPKVREAYLGVAPRVRSPTPLEGVTS
ncbi:MAG TPA: hydrogen gas-evolving membrane-bound hydrogenase subunit E, partial [Casimicrobiaceae bacterium]